ncbi:VOC family protein [Leisingera aquimarina]|uniref:VOC family protein n=1 Tax=Leisingera aquimarina TaxID=476529 RepID=UPI0004871E57|nr:VOC family protein [Leisingera aquimarina]
MPVKRLSGLRLQVKSPERLAGFYADVFGMDVRTEGEAWRAGYVGQDADLILLPGGAQGSHTRDERYWKIGICLPDLDIACEQLRQKGVEVSAPHQFRDIGYMAHLHDPEGFAIELLQHDFLGSRPDGAGDAALPLGGGAHIGQITLRTGDIAAEISAHADMKVLSVQDVTEFGFDLHFLAFTDETPPDPDLQAVANREWLWRRPYTTLEFQHTAGAQLRESPAFLGLETS